MNSKPRSEQEAASILHSLLSATDELSCEQAQQQLPSFVDNERAGVDVDQVPAYAALLQHLEHCHECTDLYEALAENLAVLTDEQADLPQTHVTPPAIFETTRRSENIVIRVFQGLKRRFAMDITMPALKPTVETLGQGQQLSLFSAKLPELTGNPFVSVALKLGTKAPELAIAVREGARPIKWHVQLHIGAQVYSATTDDRGIAHLSGFTLQQLQEADQLDVICAEIVTQGNK